MGSTVRLLEYDDTYMRVAFAVSEKSECLSGRVGACLVLPRQPGVIVPAFNRPPLGRQTCTERGECLKRFDGKKERCVNTIHAEMVAISIACAAQYDTDRAVLYMTKLPCHACAKNLSSFGIRSVFYCDSNSTLPNIGFDTVPEVKFMRVEVPI